MRSSPLCHDLSKPLCLRKRGASGSWAILTWFWVKKADQEQLGQRAPGVVPGLRPLKILGPGAGQEQLGQQALGVVLGLRPLKILGPEADQGQRVQQELGAVSGWILSLLSL